MNCRYLVPSLCFAASTALGALSAQAGAPAEATKPNYRVVFHLDTDFEPAIKKTLNNVRNVLNDPRLKGKLTVELVVNSKGYQLYTKGNAYEAALKDLLAQNVMLAQCENTLRELKVDKATLYPFVTYVPSAMGELTLREADGYAYIHPSP